MLNKQYNHGQLKQGKQIRENLKKFSSCLAQCLNACVHQTPVANFGSPKIFFRNKVCILLTGGVPTKGNVSDETNNYLISKKPPNNAQQKPWFVDNSLKNQTQNSFCQKRCCVCKLRRKVSQRETHIKTHIATNLNTGRFLDCDSCRMQSLWTNDPNPYSQS